MPEGDRFDYESARADMWDEGLDPDELPENDPIKRDAYLRKVRMDPDRYKPNRGRSHGYGQGPATGGSSNSGCFLTTACVSAKGLPDDCAELTILRAFRDVYMRLIPGGEEEIQEYYKIAPIIVKAVNERPDAERVWSRIYARVIAPAAAMIQRGEYDAAHRLYRQMVLELKDRYLAGDTIGRF